MITDEAINQIILRVDRLADKIGITVDQIWPWLVRKQYMDFYLAIGCFFVLLIVLIALSIFTAKHWNPKGLENHEIYSIYKSDHEAFFVIPLALITILLFGSAIGLMFDISSVLNPEYSALKDLMSMVNK